MALDTIMNITANTRPAEQQIDRLTSRNYGIKLNIDSQPLGRITGQLSEFNKSMDAANARVVAFGASAGAIAVLEKSFRAMIDSTIEVEKSLKDIQVVLDVSGESMAKFGKGLFDIAKNTGQSFSIAAEAATEFSRQGLGMEDTLKRTSDALILSRLSGLGAAESVNALTAAVNSFANQGVTAAEVVNKLATVDAAFAVSSKDLAEGISRVGASASQSGVSIDELIGLITSAQQATARGGAVIGNSFKTIFTRLERGKTQSLLESLGVDTKDESGKVKSTVDMLKDLAKVYGTLGQGQQAEVAEKVGGVFQINILKAALADLGKEHSVYAGAVDISNSATDEATKRNEKLNETYAAQINRLQQGATQLAAAAGKRVLGPSMDRVIGTGNGILDNLNNIDSSSIGAKLGKGLLDGIGQVIAGPGLVLLGGVIIKLLGDFSKFAGGSVKELLGLNSASKEQAAIQSSITALLEKNPALLAQINSEARTQSDQAKILLDFYMKQTAEMQKQAALTGQLASKLYTGGVRMGTEGVPVTKKAAGYIPEFASEEAQARMLGAHNPRAEWSKGTIGGQRFIKNSEETEIVGFGSNGDSAVIPHYAKGYIPNFADWGIADGITHKGNLGNALAKARAIIATANGKPFAGIKVNDNIRSQAQNFLDQKSLLSSSIQNEEIQNPIGGQTYSSIDQYAAIVGSGSGAEFNLPRFRPSSLNKGYPAHIKFSAYTAKTKPDSESGSLIEGTLKKYLSEAKLNITKQYVDSFGGDIKMPSTARNEVTGKYIGQIGALSGFLFEDIVASLLTDPEFNDYSSLKGGSAFDFHNSKGIRTMFGVPANIKAIEAKRNASDRLMIDPDYESSVANKIYSVIPKTSGKVRKALDVKKAASGYIPNFADALHESIAREISAGAPASEIYVKQYSQLASQNNPDGYGVFNRRDEGSMSTEMSAMRKKGYAKGYIPNFADESDGQGSGAAALGATGFMDIAFALSMMKNSSGEATKKINETIAAKTKELNVMQLELQSYDKRYQKAIQFSESSDRAAQAVSNMAKKTIELEANVARIRSEIPGVGQKIGARGKDFVTGGGATSVAMFAPLIAGQIAEMMPKETAGQRGAAAAVTGGANIASMAGTGFMLGGGPWGAAIGGAIAALQEIPKAVTAFSSKLPELQAASSRASDNLNEFNSRSATYVTAYDNYKAALESGSASEQNLKKLRDAYGKALTGMRAEDIKRLTAAKASGGEEGERSERALISEEERFKSQSAEKNVELAKIRDEQKSLSIKRNAFAAGFFGEERKQFTDFYGLSGLQRGDKDSKKIGDILAQGNLAGFGGDKQKELDFIKGIDLKSLRKVNTTEELAGMLTNQYKDKTGKVSEEDQNKIDQAVKIAEATGNANLVANEYADSLGRTYLADKKAIDALNERIGVEEKVKDASNQSASQIAKWIIQLQKASQISLDNFNTNQDMKQSDIAYRAKASSEDRANESKFAQMVAGKSTASIKGEYSNKIRDIDENRNIERNKVVTDFMKNSYRSAMEDFDSQFKNESTKQQGAGARGIVNKAYQSDYGFAKAEEAATKGMDEFNSIGLTNYAAETSKQNMLQSQLSNNEEIRNALKSENQSDLKNAIVEHLTKMAQLQGKTNEQLEQARAQARIDAEKLSGDLKKIDQTTAQQKQDARRSRIFELAEQSGQVGMKAFGGYQAFMQGKSGDGVAEIGSAIGIANAEAKNRSNIDLRVRSNILPGSLDAAGNVNRAVKFDASGIEDKNRAVVAGSGDYGRSLLDLNEKFSKTLGSKLGGSSLRGPGLEAAEKAVIQDRSNDLNRKFNELMGQAGYFDKTPELNLTEQQKEVRALARENLNNFINQSSGTEGKDYITGQSAEKVRASAQLGIRKVAEIQTYDAFGDYGKAKTKGQQFIEQFGGEQTRQQYEKEKQQVKDDIYTNGNSAEKAMVTEVQGVRSDLKNLTGKQIAPPSKPSQPYLIPDGKGGLYEPIGSGNAKQNEKQQQQEAAGNRGGGGNVTVGAPQINITVNGGNSSASGASDERNQADQLQRNVNSLVPELKASIEKVVRETFERRMNSLEGRMDRVAMSNQAAKPVPLGIDKTSAV